MSDVRIENHGSIFLFRLNSEAARDWVESNVSEERTEFAGALVVEHRYAADVAAGMANDGLIVD